MSNRTPTPYRLDGLNIIGADGCVVAYLNKPQGDLSGTAYRDGRFIVGACNAHADLLLHLQASRPLLALLATKTNGDEIVTETIRRVDAVLAKAEPV